MQHRGSMVMTLLLALTVLLSGLVNTTSFSIGTGTAQASAPKGATETQHHAPLTGKRAEGKQKRQLDRRHDHKQDRQQDRAKTDRKQQDKQQDRKQDRKRAARAGDWEEFCTGPESIQLTKSEGCTHGVDPAPKGFDVETPVPPLADQAAEAETATLSCVDDGQSGNRVQVLYARASDVPSRYAQYVDSIQGWTAQMDRIFQNSAAATGNERSLRVVQDPVSCLPIVEEVVLSPSGDGSFSTTMSELKSKGYTRTDRIYLAFMDTASAGICGIGTIWNDDRPTSDNWNNIGPSFSRVDAGCWSGDVAAHEVMHNLGGVQLSAPNTSGGYHCTDEYDIMCYKDSSSSPAMRIVCAQTTNNATVFDCNHDDYYNTNPAPGSYLATHWNPANSRFLIAGGTVEPPPPAPAPTTPAPPVTGPTDDDTNPSDNHKGKGKGKKGGKAKSQKKKR